jgi:hypothetical protein
MANRDPQFDTRLLIYRTRQIFLGIVVCLMTVCFAFFIRAGMEKGSHWIIIGLPLCAFACLLILIPPTEAWEYRPWQSQPKQVEQRLKR